MVVEYSKCIGSLRWPYQLHPATWMDSQMGEGNFCSAGGLNPLNNYNFVQHAGVHHDELRRLVTTRMLSTRRPGLDAAPSDSRAGPERALQVEQSDRERHHWRLVISGAIHPKAGFRSGAVSDNTGTFSGVQRQTSSQASIRPPPAAPRIVSRRLTTCRPPTSTLRPSARRWRRSLLATTRAHHHRHPYAGAVSGGRRLPSTCAGSKTAQFKRLKRSTS